MRIYLADLTYTTLSLATDAFPLNIGFIAAYANKKFGKEIELRLFKYIEDLEQAINERPPDILGVSNYPWNFNLGLEFFKMTHAVSPKTVCVMGGPNIPLDDESRTEFVKRNQLIDFYAYLEGEEAFAELITRAFDVGADREKMKSDPIDGFIHCIGEIDVMKGNMLLRRRNLDEIPSPYLTGLMDKFFDGILSPMMETNRGCPFSCTFCHEGNALISKVNFFSIERVKAELDYIVDAVHKAPSLVSNLMFADPNFAMYERDYEIVEHIEKIQQQHNWPRSIFASTGKNKKERIAKSLRKLNGSLSMWMSVQSMDPTVLTEIKRDNINTAQIMALSGVYQELGLPTLSELILGLPGDSYERHVNSLAKVADVVIDTDRCNADDVFARVVARLEMRLRRPGQELDDVVRRVSNTQRHTHVHLQFLRATHCSQCGQRDDASRLSIDGVACPCIGVAMLHAQLREVLPGGRRKTRWDVPPCRCEEVVEDPGAGLIALAFGEEASRAWFLCTHSIVPPCLQS